MQFNAFFIVFFACFPQPIFDFEEAEVVPTEYLSPIHLFKKDHRFPSAYQQRIVGGEMPGEHVQTSSRTS